MSLVIVTTNQYLIASKIHFVNLNEDSEHIDLGFGEHRKSFKKLTYNIHIVYTAESTGNTNSTRDEHRECNLTIRGKVNAHRVFRDLIRQIREQTPDQLYLDAALEALLSKELSIVAEEEQQELLAAKEFGNDRSAKKVRGARKAKRRNKKVLRKPKRSN